jgi:putative transposase
MATRKRHSPEQIVRKLMAADRPLAEGKDTAAVCRELGVSEATYHRWRNQFGGLKAEDTERLKDLERENATLKRLLADAEPEKDAAAGDREGKLLRPERRRAAVRHLQRVLGVSERFACRVTRQHRATQRHEPDSATRDDPDAALGSGCVPTPRIIPAAGSGPPTTTPGLKAGPSITRRSNAFGATKDYEYRSGGDENATAPPRPRRR